MITRTTAEPPNSTVLPNKRTKKHGFMGNPCANRFHRPKHGIWQCALHKIQLSSRAWWPLIPKDYGCGGRGRRKGVGLQQLHSRRARSFRSSSTNIFSHRWLFTTWYMRFPCLSSDRLGRQRAMSNHPTTWTKRTHIVTYTKMNSRFKRRTQKSIPFGAIKQKTYFIPKDLGKGCSGLHK